MSKLSEDSSSVPSAMVVELFVFVAVRPLDLVVRSPILLLAILEILLRFDDREDR